MNPKNTISADETPQAEYVDARLARESTEDYVIRRIQERLKGRPFEELVADMWRVMGYRALLNPDGKNGKYDVRAGKGPLGVEPPLLKIECKSAPDAKPDHKDVSSLANQLLAGELGIFIALAGFARGTDREFREKPIRLIDRADFVALFLQLYPELSSRFKDLIPLRREWVPPAEAVPKNEPASADEGSDDDAYSADESLGAL
jgi:restriction system protein